MFKEKAIKFSTFFNFHKTKTPQKLLFIKDFKNSRLNKDKKKVIEKYLDKIFTDDSKFFDLNPNVIIGKKPQGPRYDSENNIVPYSVVGPIIQAKKRINKLQSIPVSKSNSFEKSQSVSKATRQKSNKYEASKNFDLLNEKEVIQLYKDIENKLDGRKNSKKKLKKSIKYRNKREKEKNLLPKTIQKCLTAQEKFLQNSKILFKEIENNEDYLSKKIKRDKNELMMSNEDYQTIQQKKLIIENSVSNMHKYGDKYWYLSLRNSNNITNNKMDANANKSEKRYVDLSNCESNQIWVPMRLNTINTVSLKPKGESGKLFSKTDYNFFKKRDIYPYKHKSRLNFSISKSNTNYNEIASLKKCLKKTNMEPNLFNSMNYLEIQGTNLFDFEKNRELSSKCKNKKFYKKNILDAVQYLKKINVNIEYLNERDIKKQTINIFKDETYANNYSSRDLCKNYYTLKAGDYNYI